MLARMRRESISLQDLDDRGHDVRAWCFACGRGAVIDSIIWQRFAARGWAQDLHSAACRFRCRSCRSAASVALYPTRRPPAPANSASLLVEAWFHGLRGAHKRARRR